MQNLTILQQLTLSVIPIILALTVKEGLQAICACYLGDSTPKQFGRDTLNPTKHIDVLGTILFPLCCVLSNIPILLGWAKPVPIVARNLRHPRRDQVLIAIAGPGANLLMALMWALSAKLFYYLSQNSIYLSADLIRFDFLLLMAQKGIMINAVLAIFHLLPIPPLDGSKILAGFLSPKWASAYMQISKFSLIIFILLLMTRAFQWLILPGATLIWTSMIAIIQF